MYKLLVFLKKTDEEQVNNHFNEFTLKYLSEIAGKEIKAAKVESNLLLETKYSKFCELEAASRDEMDKLLDSKAGRELSKDFQQFHEFITLISVDFNK
jgi:hypothetical protein